MEFDPKVPPYSTSDQTSFAYISARDRWPVIITGAIDDVHRAVSACNDIEKVKEGKAIVENIAKLKYELQHNRNLRPLIDDGGADIATYNTELSARDTPSWFAVSWLYAECYLYRRLHTLFSTSTYWRSYDVFARQKLSTFRSSRSAVMELAGRYRTLIEELSSGANQADKSREEIAAAERLLFTEMAEICLWGNATDLSLLTSLSYDDIQKLQGSQARKDSEKNILVNDLPAAFESLKASRSANPSADRTVDIILDNAGFELFVDLLLAGYLISSNLCSHVILHPKSQPWFVSDVTPPDFAALLNALADPRAFYTAPTDDDKDVDRGSLQPLGEIETEDIAFLFEHWSGLHAEGKLALRPNGFWTGPGSYWRLAHGQEEKEKALWEDLRSSGLVIFKGDLNYRKLTGDVMWPPTTPFASSLGPLGPGSGIRTLALRTCKADVVVGLPEGKDEEIRATEGGGGDGGARKWAWSGKWAVVQFCDGKKE
ncbi:MAG: hypothetical protein LQ340_000973 [Diploschistes diacapsis]|nr:MAG: hypothetical protein LQ340_000973 [Diploschistes diacapsis]